MSGHLEISLSQASNAKSYSIINALAWAALLRRRCRSPLLELLWARRAVPFLDVAEDLALYEIRRGWCMHFSGRRRIS